VAETRSTEDLEKGTMRGYDAPVRLHIGPTIGAVKLAHLSTPMLEAWRDRLVTKHSRRLARKILGTLKSILGEAQRRGLVAQNAALPVRVDAKKRDVRKLEVGIDVPDREQVGRLLAAFRKILFPFALVVPRALVKSHQGVIH